MAQSTIHGASIRGISTAVPSRVFDNVRHTTALPKDDVRKVVAMAGVAERRVADDATCSSDLCLDAADALLADLGWPPDSIDALIMVTQTPDYFMPSASCVVHKRLGLSQRCAALDVGLGCSGYPYGLWLSSMMVQTGDVKRVLLLHGETPTRYAREDDRSVSLLFGDVGSATAVERDTDAVAPWYFTLHTDGSGFDDLIIEAGGFRDRFSADPHAHYVRMNGANVFNFTIKVIPPLIADTLRLSGKSVDNIDVFALHQSNRFIIQHLIVTCGLSPTKVPIVLDRFGNAGGPSVPLVITQGLPEGSRGRAMTVMMIGYGAGLSWGAALLPLTPAVVLRHVERPLRPTSPA
jgi:3-oxoacyl-[acyl-carrier-protein] synthase-3